MKFHLGQNLYWITLESLDVFVMPIIFKERKTNLEKEIKSVSWLGTLKGRRVGRFMT